jgi:hypothetical protein
VCRLPGEVILKHALDGNGLDEFDEEPSVISLGGQLFTGRGLTVVGHAQILCADMFWLGKASDRQSVRQEFYGGLNIRNYPANLGQFKSGDGIIEPVHVCLPFGLW